MKTLLRCLGVGLRGHRLLRLVSVLCLWSGLRLHAATWGAFNYEREGDTIAITGYKGTDRSATIPETIEGRPVTAIAAYAFSSRNAGSITNLSLPATLISLGDAPDFLEGSLDELGSLEAITVAEGNAQFTSRDGLLFSRDQTTLLRCPQAWAGDYSAPETVRRIGARAFRGCRNLGRLTLPHGVTEVGERAFEYCPSLISVTASADLVPAVVAAASYSGRMDPASHLRFLIVNEHVAITDHDYWLDFWFQNPPIELEIPPRFDGRPVTFIGNSACQAMSLSMVTIPATVTSIGDGAFAWCSTLQSIRVADDSSAFLSLEGVLFSRDMKSLIQCPAGKTGAYAVPEGVTQIRGSAFSGCQASAVALPTGLTEIQPDTFAGCVNLHQVNIPEQVTKIGAGAFANCSLLLDMTIPDGVEEIGARAFWRSGLRTVVIGRGVRRIGDDAFDTTDIRCNSDPCYDADIVGGAMDLYFLGEAPESEWPFGRRTLSFRKDFSVPPRVFRLTSASGWNPVWGHMPTTEWSGEPVLLEQPMSAYRLVGAALQLSARAVGLEPLTFEWQQHGRTVPAATNATVSLNPLAAEAAGPWQVVVRNPFGAVTSAVATVTVRVPVANGYEAAAVALHPLAYWPLDEAPGETTMESMTGTAGHFSGTPEAGQSGATSNTGRSVALDGTSGVVAPHNPAWDVGTGDFTVAAWINPTSFYPSALVAQGGNGWGDGWQFDFSFPFEGTLRLKTSWGAAETLPGVVTLGEWQHVVVSCRRDPVAGPGVNTTGNGWTRIYRNGVLVASGDIGPGNLNNSFLPLTLGGTSDMDSFSGFIGRMDEVALFGEALSAEQVADLYAAGLGVPPPLRFTRVGDQLTLTWSGGVLQSATTLGDDGQPAGWSDLAAATSPWTLSLTNAASFFRVQTP